MKGEDTWGTSKGNGRCEKEGRWEEPNHCEKRSRVDGSCAATGFEEGKKREPSKYKIVLAIGVNTSERRKE